LKAKEKPMLKPLATLALGLSLSLNVLTGCKGKEEKHTYRPKQNQDVSVVANNVGDGLDLSQLPALVREAKNGEALEKTLNESGVNNLDLNNDGNIDYLNVEEFREGDQRGFVLFTNENNERSDVAQVMISQNAQQAEVAVQGNPNYYPPNTVYRNHFPLGEILLAAWLFDMARPRFYHPPYYRGYYPSYYRGGRVVPFSSYRGRLSSSAYRTKYRTSGFGSGSTRTRGSLGSKTSFNTGKTTTTTRSGMNQSRNSLSNVKGSSFGTTTNKRPVGSGGTSTSSFGSSSSRSRTTGSTTGSTAGSTSGSSFGSSSNRSSTGSSFGSSSSRSSTGSTFGSSSNRSRSGSSFGSSSGSSSRSSFGSSSSRSSGSSSRRRR
jgi:hypothetical protein